jgi:uncharacterized protein (DUF849 family)
MKMQLPQNSHDWHDAAPLKITVAPNGARRGRKDHPELPMTTAQIAQTAQKCAVAGADELHLHVREGDGTHSLDAGRYREAVSAVQDLAPELAIQITTEAAGRYDVAAQFAVLKQLTPKAASVSIREIARDPEMAPQVYAYAREAGIGLQHILYDTDDLNQLAHWQNEGVIARGGCDVLLVLGRYAPPQPAQVAELAPFAAQAAGVADRWMVCAFGHNEHAVAQAAIKLGGHLRIGFENNIQRPDGSLAADNAENILRAADAARALGRPLLKEVTK